MRHGHGDLEGTLLLALCVVVTLVVISAVRGVSMVHTSTAAVLIHLGKTINERMIVSDKSAKICVQQGIVVQLNLNLHAKLTD